LRMPLVIVLGLLDVILIVHAAKTGRFWPWAYVILLLPGVGAIAYLLVEVVPAWAGSAQGQQAKRKLANAIDPLKRYRELTDNLEIADTIAARVALAQECLVLGKFEEAKQHYERILRQPMGDEPGFMLGSAQADFGLGRPAEAVATLDRLRQRWPDFQSADGHLLYARALEDSGRLDEALYEYKALASYYPGAEARVRYGMLLTRVGRRAEAEQIFRQVLAHMRRAPRYVRKAQAQWIAEAKKHLDT